MRLAFPAFLILLIGSLTGDAAARSLVHDFRPGQVWTFHLDASEPAATLTILKVETHEKFGELVHISVSAVRVPGGVTRIGHLPMAREALARSVIAMIRTDTAPPDLGGYQAWKEANGGVFTASVSEAMSFVRQAIERNTESQ